MSKIKWNFEIYNYQIVEEIFKWNVQLIAYFSYSKLEVDKNVIDRISTSISSIKIHSKEMYLVQNIFY